MANHDTTLTLQLIRLLEQYPDGLGSAACHEKLRPRQASSTVRGALTGMLRHHIVVRHGTRRRYTYALRPDFRQAFAGREDNNVCL
jgi:DNA-binding IclR family transcriptional regulator